MKTNKLIAIKAMFSDAALGKDTCATARPRDSASINERKYLVGSFYRGVKREARIICEAGNRELTLTREIEYRNAGNSVVKRELSRKMIVKGQ